jgi:dTDP-4-dehydrorhamnose 3,5-epimerase
MKIEKLAIPEVLLITPPRYGDDRGYFSETYSLPRAIQAGLTAPFVQDNQSFSRAKGTLRGLHCQLAPYAQGKLVRVLRGAIWDVAVDARTGSPTFGQHAAAILSADNGSQLWIPPGFLHGFCTIEPDTEVAYKVTEPYDRASERGVIWNDPTLALPWPLDEAGAVLSDKDRILPLWPEAKGWFTAPSPAARHVSAELAGSLAS